MAVFVEGVFSQDRNPDSELRGKREERERAGENEGTSLRGCPPAHECHGWAK